MNASLPSPAWDASIGTISPASFRASTAAIVYVDIARGDLDAGGLERLARLGDDLPRRLVGPLAERAGDADEDLGPLVRGKRVAHRPLRRVDRRAGLCGTCLRDARDDRSVEGRRDLEPVARLGPLTVEQQLSLRSRGRHAAQSMPPCETSGVDARRSFYPVGASATIAELEADPHELLDRLRAREPVSWLPVLDGWLVTRRDQALAVDARRGDVHRRRPALLDRAGRRAEHALARRRGARATPLPLCTFVPTRRRA